MRVINILKSLEMTFFLKIIHKVKIRINSRGGGLNLKAPLQLTLKPLFFPVAEKHLLKIN